VRAHAAERLRTEREGNGNTARMARYATTIRSQRAPAEAFAYMADFSNARHWDPSVSEAQRDGDGPLGTGSTFDLVARFAGRSVALRYTIVAYEPPSRVVLEARRGFISRDTITVEPTDGDGLTVHCDALLSFSGIGRLFDPIMQLVFNRVGARAAAGIDAALACPVDSPPAGAR
jgi:Polyketide cyclase / dehydrase and lipid transport